NIDGGCSGGHDTEAEIEPLDVQRRPPDIQPVDTYLRNVDFPGEIFAIGCGASGLSVRPYIVYFGQRPAPRRAGVSQPDFKPGHGCPRAHVVLQPRPVPVVIFGYVTYRLHTTEVRAQADADFDVGK